MDLEQERLALRTFLSHENGKDVFERIDKYRQNALLQNDEIHLAHANFYDGRARISTGEYNKALKYLKESTEVYLKHEINIFLQASYIARGNINYNLGNFEEALKFYENAAQIAGEFNQYKASALVSKSQILLEFNQFDQALAVSTQTLKHLSIKIPEERSFYFQVLLNLASIHTAKNNLKKTEEILQKLSKALKAHPSALIEARLKRNLANLYIKQTKFELAIEQLNLGLEICRTENFKIVELEILIAKGNCFILMNQLQKAQECLEFAYNELPRNDKMRLKELLFHLISLYEFQGEKKLKREKEEELDELLSY